MRRVKYIVRVYKNGEKGCSSEYEYLEEFNSFKEANDYYKKGELDDYDFSTYAKTLYRVHKIKTKAFWKREKIKETKKKRKDNGTKRNN